MNILAESSTGWVSFEGNELTIGSKVADPPKVRLVSPITNEGGGGGVVSYNAGPLGRVCSGSEQREMAMDRVEQADDVRGQTNCLKAERNFQLNDGSSDSDSAMRKPLAFIWNAITRSMLSMFGGGATDTMWAPSGLFFTQQQADGNFVSYRVDRPFDKGANPKALWSAWTGKIG